MWGRRDGWGGGERRLRPADARGVAGTAAGPAPPAARRLSPGFVARIPR